MKVLIVYCHPSDDSFTKHMCDAFIKGIVDSGNEYILSDLYKMDFDPTMTEQEYLRDAYYRNTPDIASDVLVEQEKINSADAIAFVYPVFWTEAPAKLVGWFDRVWSYGFAYGEKTMKELDKAIILCSAGNPNERLEQFGLLDSMKKVMLGDRLFGRARETEFIVFDNTSRENELREKNWDINLRKAYEKGKSFFSLTDKTKKAIRLETKRLILRDFAESDFEAYYKLKTDDQTMYYLQDIKQKSIDAARTEFTGVLDDMKCTDRKYYFLYMELKDSHEQVGSIGYTVTDETPAGKMVHLGYFTYPVFWGNGYTTEALKKVLEYAFTAGNVYRVTTGCLAENIGSERVMQKNGMIKEAEHLDYEWHDGKMKTRLEYRLLKNEWAERNGYLAAF
jgi:NAD(P)H dehydrogenase (quinone)